MLAALTKRGRHTMSSLVSEACLDGVPVKEEDDLEEAGAEGAAGPVGPSTPGAPSTLDPQSSG
eukprot:6893769-Alexandrium_andersonii.AAC.1